MTRFYTLQEVYRAAWIWYKKSDADSCCLAENRLMRGESLTSHQESGKQDTCDD